MAAAMQTNSSSSRYPLRDQAGSDLHVKADSAVVSGVDKTRAHREISFEISVTACGIH